MQTWLAEWGRAAWPGIVPMVLLLALTLYGTARAIFVPWRISSVRWRLSGPNRRRYPFLRRLLLVPGTNHSAMRDKQSLLHACGLSVDAVSYTVWKRLGLLASAGSMAVVWFSLRDGAGNRGTGTVVMLLLAGIALLLALDGLILDKLRSLRRYRIVRELDSISRHLLYTGGQRTNLHGRLLGCLPLTRVIRPEWVKLTADWYQGAEEALNRFHERLGGEEARVFAETLNALRQEDDERYYGLLRERIDDNKEKMELMRESRREAISYLLFLLAGVPIMYTFRLFIHPWVAEGQKLFQLLD